MVEKDIGSYTGEQSDLLWQWDEIMRLLKDVRNLNQGDVESLHIWHNWAFDEGCDIGLIKEMCEIRDKYE